MIDRTPVDVSMKISENDSVFYDIKKHLVCDFENGAWTVQDDVGYSTQGFMGETRVETIYKFLKEQFVRDGGRG